MKLLAFLTLVVTLASAQIPDPRVDGARPGLLRRPLRDSERPTSARSNMPMVAARTPQGAPSRYVCALGEATNDRPVGNLKPLYGSGVFERRKREYVEAKRALLRLRQSNADFYECPYAVRSLTLLLRLRLFLLLLVLLLSTLTKKSWYVFFEILKKFSIL